MCQWKSTCSIHVKWDWGRNGETSGQWCTVYCVKHWSLGTYLGIGSATHNVRTASAWSPALGPLALPRWRGRSRVPGWAWEWSSQSLRCSWAGSPQFCLTIITLVAARSSNSRSPIDKPSFTCLASHSSTNLCPASSSSILCLTLIPNFRPILKMAWLSIFSTAGVLLFTGLGYLVHVVYSHRRKINELRKRGVVSDSNPTTGGLRSSDWHCWQPMPKEWSWITGHLLVLQKYLDGVPPDAAVALAMRDLCEEHADTELFLMDFWPVYPPLFTVFGPESINQICNKYNLPKPAVASRFMEPVTGGPNLISMNGDEWKYWRSLFNPGFSTGAMLNGVPHIVDSVLVFREKLIQRIGKGMFSLDELATKLTQEIILKVTL